MAAQPMNVMSFNIRLNTPSDSLNAWPNRKEKVISQILFHEVHLLGVQEALHDQMMDLQQGLKNFKFTGKARDDGKQKGEYSAIFYDTSKFELVGSNTFWLSKTPEIPGSKDWDAAITRIVTWARFRDIKSGKLFYVFNTHFDHMGKEARKESAKILLNKVKELAGKIPAVVMGDFNSTPADEPITILTDKNNKDHLRNTSEISLTPHYGPTGTFNAFRSSEINDQPIDHIFIKGEWLVLSHATISQAWGGRFASDHFAVFVKLDY